MILVKDHLDDPYPHVRVFDRTYKSASETVTVDPIEGEEEVTFEERIKRAITAVEAKAIELDEARGVVRAVKLAEKV